MGTGIAKPLIKTTSALIRKKSLTNILGDVPATVKEAIKSRITMEQIGIDKGWRSKYSWEEFKVSPDADRIRQLSNIREKIDNNIGLEPDELRYIKSVAKILLDDTPEPNLKFVSKEVADNIMLFKDKIRKLSEAK